MSKKKVALQKRPASITGTSAGSAASVGDVEVESTRIEEMRMTKVGDRTVSLMARLDAALTRRIEHLEALAAELEYQVRRVEGR